MAVIQQEMANAQLVVRNHIDELTAKSQLIVYESQEALFYKNGQALDLFGPGRHTLDTQNLPLLKRIFAALFNGKDPFPCDIYFINKVNVLDFQWGTSTPIDLIDPRYSVLIGVRAHGQMGLRINDARKFVIKVAGMLGDLTVESLKATLKGMIMSPIKECIAATILDKQVSILEITPRLGEIAEEIEMRLNSRIADLGIEIVHMNLNGVMASEGDLDALRAARNEMLTGKNTAEIEAYKMKTIAAARAEARRTEGFTYEEERRFDILEGAAKNEGAAGGLINMGVGLGMGTGIGREVGKMADAVQSPAASPAGACANCGQSMDPAAKFCSNCGQARPVARFCSECGSQVTPGAKFCPNCGTKLG